MLSIEERVNNGMNELDAMFPWWREKINCAILDMFSHQDCVLGQIFESYYVGYKTLALDEDTVIYYGFETGEKYDGNDRSEYNKLTNEWTRQLLGAA